LETVGFFVVEKSFEICYTLRMEEKFITSVLVFPFVLALIIVFALFIALQIIALRDNT